MNTVDLSGPHVRPAIQAIPRYIPGKPVSELQRETGVLRAVKLASNENPMGPSPLALAALAAAQTELHRYPDGAAYELKTALSHHLGQPFERLVVGSGSDEIIHLLGLVTLESPDDEVVVGDPSFVRYDATAQIAGCRLVRVPLDADARFDLDATLAAIGSHTRLVFIANPNNPTGTIVGRQALIAFLERVPPQVAVVLDEAYFEYAIEDPDYLDGASVIDRFPNLIVLRTFSKAYGLAGLRVGYGIAHEVVIDTLERVRGPFNVGTSAQAAATAALADTAHLAASLALNREQLPRITQALAGGGARVFETRANFVCADFGRPIGPLSQALLQRGIITRGGPALRTPHGIRVSVGTADEVDAFIAALAEAVAEVSPA